MKTKDFFYELPEGLIAETATEPRDASKLMVLNRQKNKIEHRIFSDIVDYLNPGDLLVLNNSKVLPARLMGRFATGGEFEILLLNDRGEGLWECMVRPGRKLRDGTLVEYGDGELTAKVVDTLEGGNRIIKFTVKSGSLMDSFYKFGKLPLPPYIKNTKSEEGRYQTVYAKHLGSAAAPTAGLHFTDRLLDTLKNKGVNIAEVTLHVGVGTFKPVEAERIEDHVMHSEWYEVSDTAASIINNTKKNQGRVIAVGTTAARTLEGMYQRYGEIKAGGDSTDIFITPGYIFNVVDSLITNFHLPQSTLLMLVSALAGKEFIDSAYKIAIEQRYRFYSFGDAMIIL